MVTQLFAATLSAQRTVHPGLALYLDNHRSVIVVYVGKFGSSNAPSNHIQHIAVQ
jgi:hypothetical protein